MKDSFDRGHGLAQKTAQGQIEFVMANLASLRKVDKTGKHEKAAKQFNAIIKSGRKLTPNQLSYVDGIYEKTMKGAGFPSIGLKIDAKKRGCV